MQPEGPCRWVGSVKLSVLAAATVLVAVLVVLVVLVWTPSGSTVPEPVSFADRGVRLGVLANADAYAPDRMLFLARQVSRPGAEDLDALMRVDPRSLRVLVSLRLASTFDDALLVGSVLWVTSSVDRRLWLWRLDARSLRVLARMMLPGGRSDTNEGALAFAGGWLWVGGADCLDRVSPETGNTTAQIRVSASNGIEVAADPAGRVLLDSEGQELSHVQRRDPRTGRLLAASATFIGVTRPRIGGITGRWAWISEGTGMMGYAARLALGNLSPVAPAREWALPGLTTPTEIEGSNAVRAMVLDGVLWITQPDGGPQRNYCADPKTGLRRAALAIPPAGELLTANATTIYYLDDADDPYSERLASAPINPACEVAGDDAAVAVPNPQLVSATFECVGGQLRLSNGPAVIPQTGEHAAIVEIQNISKQRCALSGYPRVTLSSEGRALAFAYQDGGGPYMSTATPPMVMLRAGGQGYLLIAKYRCDGRTGASVQAISVVIPDVPGTLTVAIPNDQRGVEGLSYCRRYPGDLQIDPGDRIAISPIEPTLASIYRLQQRPLRGLAAHPASHAAQ